MKKLSILLLLYSIYSFGQEDPNQLPDYTPPSPQAWSFTKYGDLQADEMTGRASVSVPLYNYQVNGFNLPISMSYRGSGVTVNESSSWTGIKWHLTGGGVITRTVRDMPDEFGSRVFLNETDLNSMDLYNGSADAELLNTYLNVPGWDTETDVFQFNFMNNSGTFYLDTQGNPVIVKNTNNLKIEIIGSSNASNITNLYSNKEFVITDMAGTKYYFGGTNYIEDSRPITATGASNVSYTTSFYISKIVTITNDEIYFTYDNQAIESEKLSEEESYSDIFGLNAIDYSPSPAPANHPNAGEPLCTDHASTLKGLTFNESRFRYSDVKYLSSISANNSPIRIDFNSIYNCSNRELNSISISNSGLIKKILFEYDYYGDVENCDRFFLSKIIDEDLSTNGTDDKVHSFEYNNPEALPALFAKSQDHLGYYNGKNNTTLLPKINNPNSPFYNKEYPYGDREPDFNYSIKGALTKVKYPTGGITYFEYEPHQKKEIVTKTQRLTVFSNLPINSQDLNDSFFIGDESQLPSFEEVDLNDPYGFHIPYSEDSDVIEDQNIIVNFDLELDGNYACDTSQFFNREFVRLQVINHTLNTTEYIGFDDYSDSMNRINICSFNDVNNNPYEFPVTIQKGHSYTFHLNLHSHSELAQPFPTDARIEVDAVFNFLKNEYVDDAGLRVKRISDYLEDDITTEPLNVKRYYYSKVNSNNESRVGNYVFQYDYQWQFTDACHPYGNILCFLNSWLVSTLTSNSINSLFISTDNSVLYRYVTTSIGDDNYKNGGVEKKFSIHDLASSGNNFSTYNSSIYRSKPYRPQNPLDNFTGEVLETRYIKNKDGQLSFLRTEKNAFSNIPINFMTNMAGGAEHFICTYLTVNGYENLNIHFYETAAFTHNILSSIAIDYLEPLPINEVDDSAYKKVVTNSTYEYASESDGSPTNGLNGLPIKVITSSSETDEQYETYNVYVHQSNTLENISNVSDYTTLINQNRISQPIKTSNYINKNGVLTLLGTSQTMYSSNNDSSKVFPTRVLSSKNSDVLEPRIEFLEYNSDGRPTLIKQTNGTLVHYKYNNKGQVMRKIVNHTSPNATLPINQSGFVETSVVCDFIKENFPNSQVSYYFYDDETNLLNRVIDPRCYETTYEYDEYQRLKHVRDANGNILSENEYNYRTQN